MLVFICSINVFRGILPEGLDQSLLRFVALREVTPHEPEKMKFSLNMLFLTESRHQQSCQQSRSPIPALEEKHLSSQRGNSIQNQVWVAGIRSDRTNRLRSWRLIRVGACWLKETRIVIIMKRKNQDNKLGMSIVSVCRY